LKEEKNMECPKCGAILEEDSKFCVACGAHLDSVGDATPASPNPIEERDSGGQPSTIVVDTKESKQSILKNVNPIGLIVGTIIIIVGIVRILTAGTSISSTSFGGDFYTYTYRGIVAISEILASVEVSLGWVIVAIGAAIDVHSLRN
jgi:hypothetical protein